MKTLIGIEQAIGRTVEQIISSYGDGMAIHLTGDSVLLLDTEEGVTVCDKYPLLSDIVFLGIATGQERDELLAAQRKENEAKWESRQREEYERLRAIYEPRSV